MANILITNQAIVTASSSPTLIRAANGGRTYFSVALPVAGTVWVGGPGVTTTGAGRGFPVLLNQPFVMPGGDDRYSSIYSGDIWGITTAIATVGYMEISN